MCRPASRWSWSAAAHRVCAPRRNCAARLAGRAVQRRALAALQPRQADAVSRRRGPDRPRLSGRTSFPPDAPITQYNGQPSSASIAPPRPSRTSSAGAGAIRKLVLCLGSRAHIPPIPGRELPGVFSFRNFDDVEQLVARSDPLALHRRDRRRPARPRSGARHGAAQDQDRRRRARKPPDGAPARQRRRRGAGATKSRAWASRCAPAVRSRSSPALAGWRASCCRPARPSPATRSIICTGIRSNIELARDAGIAVGHGITVNDAMQTSDPDDLCGRRMRRARRPRLRTGLSRARAGGGRRRPHRRRERRAIAARSRPRS